ncbi:MAG: hypothetical protein Q9228_007836 [Teloschistes exilis]
MDHAHATLDQELGTLSSPGPDYETQPAYTTADHELANEAAATASERIDRLTRAILIQLSTISGTESDMQMVEKIENLTSRTRIGPENNIVTSIPPLNCVSTDLDQPAFMSTPYGFWIMVQYGSLADVLRSGQTILNTRPISTQTAEQICWLEDALPLLANRVRTTTTPESTRVVLFILYAVAHSRNLDSSFDPDDLLTNISQYIEQLNDGFILHHVHQAVSDFVVFGQAHPITSWQPALDDSLHSLDHTKGALSQGLQITADGSGVLMLSQETADGISTYILVIDDVDSWVRRVHRPGEMRLVLKDQNSVCVPPELLTLSLGALDTMAAPWAMKFMRSLVKVEQ